MLGEQLIQFLRQPQPPASFYGTTCWPTSSYRLSFATEDQAAIRSTLLELLHMIFRTLLPSVAMTMADGSGRSADSRYLTNSVTAPLR